MLGGGTPIFAGPPPGSLRLAGVRRRFEGSDSFVVRYELAEAAARALASPVRLPLAW